MVDPALANGFAGILKGGGARGRGRQPQSSLLKLLRQVFGDLKNPEGQRFAIEIGRLPAQRGVSMTALRDQQCLGVAGDGLIDQALADLALPILSARVIALVLSQYPVAAKGAGHAQVLHHARQCSHGGWIMLDVGPGHA